MRNPVYGIAEAASTQLQMCPSSQDSRNVQTNRDIDLRGNDELGDKRPLGTLQALEHRIHPEFIVRTSGKRHDDIWKLNHHPGISEDQLDYSSVLPEQ